MNYKLKGIVVFVLFSFAALGLGVAIPKLIIHNATNISKAENHCGKKAAYKIISDNYKARHGFRSKISSLFPGLLILFPIS